MSEQNKNTGAPTSSIVSTPKPNVGQPTTDAGKKDAQKASDLEQGRAHTPNVDAKKEAADARRTTEQAHVPTAKSDVDEKPEDEANDREEDEAVGVKRTAAEGQDERKLGSEPAKPVASSGSNGKS